MNLSCSHFLGVGKHGGRKTGHTAVFCEVFSGVSSPDECVLFSDKMATRSKQGGEADSAFACSNAPFKQECVGLSFFRLPKDETRYVIDLFPQVCYFHLSCLCLCCAMFTLQSCRDLIILPTVSVSDCLSV